MSDHKRNTEGLKAFACEKREQAAKKVDKAIQEIMKEKGKINFHTVSLRAGISKAYLYNQPQVREKIQTLRKEQEGLPSPGLAKHRMSESGKDVLLAAKNKRIKELEEENKRLKEEVMKLRGKIYEGVPRVESGQ